MILFFSDLHVHHTHRFSHITPEGRTIRELEHLMCADKIVELIDEYPEINKVVFGGDMIAQVGDNLSTQCLDTVCEFIEKIQKKCIERNIFFDILVGNHDISSHLNNQYSHKLIAFKNWKNVNVYDQPVVDGNFVYVPFCINDDFATSFLENVEKKDEKIVFSHLELKNIHLGSGIFSTKGVDFDILNSFKVCLQGHYHNGGKYGNKIYVSGSTQRLSFKDQGISRNNILLYDENTGKVIRKSFDCPDWLMFTDENIEDLLKVSNDNYVRVDVSMDILLTDEIKDKISKMKGSDVHVDISRIVVNKKINSSEDVGENEVDVIKQFINKSDNSEDDKKVLIDRGISLIERVKE